MRTSLLLLIPSILVVGLLIGVYRLHNFAPAATVCALGECPLQVNGDDAGKTFTYAVATRFTVFLDEGTDPQAHLQCSPLGVIGPISNAPPAVPPKYAARFEGLHAGTCTLSDDHFSAIIVIE